MNTGYEFARMALQHFMYAAVLAGIFAAVMVAYLVALWRVAATLQTWTLLLIHTAYLLWQSNIAFVAVVSLVVATHNRDLAGEMMEPWALAPFIVPGAIILYALMMLISVLLVTQRRRQGHAANAAGAGQ